MFTRSWWSAGEAKVFFRLLGSQWFTRFLDENPGNPGQTMIHQYYDEPIITRSHAAPGETSFDNNPPLGHDDHGGPHS